MSKQAAGDLSLKRRAAEELRKYLSVSAYLFVCFAVILLYESSLVEAHEPLTLTLGAALLKALVIGKFVLIGEMLGAGERLGASTLLRRIAARSLGLLLILFLLKIVEEALIGLIRGPGVRAALAQLLDQPLLQLVAPLLLMLLILVPMVAAIELSRVLGRDRFQQLLRGQAAD